MSAWAERAGFAWGRAIGVYSRRVIRPERFLMSGPSPAETGPAVWACWHGSNLILLEAFHHLDPGRMLLSFVLPGVLGAIGRGRFAGTRTEALLLPGEQGGAPSGALKRAAAGLAAGQDIAIAVDGPHGPAGRVRPGALWLARLSGRPLVPVGCAADPAFELPRWDRHLIPLPGARVALVFDEPLAIDRRAPLDAALFARLAGRLDRVNERARALLAGPPAA